MTEPLLARIARKIKYRLEHIRRRNVVIDRATGETARWYPDHAGGVLHHKDWWALVNSEQLSDLEDRLASDERDFHICKIKKRVDRLLIDMNYNPLAAESSITIQCGVCRSYSCCRPNEHGITDLYEQMRALLL